VRHVCAHASAISFVLLMYFFNLCTLSAAAAAAAAALSACSSSTTRGRRRFEGPGWVLELPRSSVHPAPLGQA